MRGIRRGALALLAIVPLVLAACGGDDDVDERETPGEGETTDVTLMLDWTPNTNHLGIYVAHDQGWYEEAGINLQIVEPAPAGVEQVVGAGGADFGVSFQDYMTPARAQGVPIVSIAAIVQHNTSSFMALADEGIESAADLAGHRYGGFVGPLPEAIIQEIVQCDGGDPSQVEFVDAAIDPLVGLQDDQFDFFWVFDGWDGIRAEQVEGIDVSYVRFIDYLECIPDWYTPLLITSESMIENNPDVVARFMEATVRGYEYAIENPDEAATILLDRVPELDEQLVRLSAEYLSTRFVDEGRQWGLQDEEVWIRFTEFMADAGIIDEAIEVSEAYTNEFLPE